MLRRIATVGGGVSGLGAAWALHHHPDRFDFRLFEAHERIGGNTVTADMPQDDGSTIPFDDPAAKAVVQLLREHHVRLAIQEGVALSAS